MLNILELMGWVQFVAVFFFIAAGWNLLSAFTGGRSEKVAGAIGDRIVDKVRGPHEAEKIAKLIEDNKKSNDKIEELENQIEIEKDKIITAINTGNPDQIKIELDFFKKNLDQKKNNFDASISMLEEHNSIIHKYISKNIDISFNSEVIEFDTKLNGYKIQIKTLYDKIMGDIINFETKGEFIELEFNKMFKEMSYGFSKIHNMGLELQESMKIANRKIQEFENKERINKTVDKHIKITEIEENLAIKEWKDLEGLKSDLNSLITLDGVTGWKVRFKKSIEAEAKKLRWITRVEWRKIRRESLSDNIKNKEAEIAEFAKNANNTKNSVTKFNANKKGIPEFKEHAKIKIDELINFNKQIAEIGKLLLEEYEKIKKGELKGIGE